MTRGDEQRPGSSDSSRATVGNPGIRQFTARLDALKARLARMQAAPKGAGEPETSIRHRAIWDIHSHALEDIERLVAVLEAAQVFYAIIDEEEGFCPEIYRGQQELRDALAYWLAESEEAE